MGKRKETILPLIIFGTPFVFHFFMKNQQGVFHVFCISLLFLIYLSGFGIWGFLRHWRLTMETQLRLDRCVGTTAQAIRNDLNELERLNQKIKNIRQLMEISKLFPKVLMTLKVQLYVYFGKQEWILMKWKKREILWLVNRGCDQKDIPFPLPAIPYHREGVDCLGPKPLHLWGYKKIQFELRKGSRCSKAEIEWDLSWKSHWISCTFQSFHLRF